MNRFSFAVTSMKRLLFILFFAQQAFSQGYDAPLTVQGIDHNTLHSAASRALGGTTLILQNEPAMMFEDPASLQSLRTIQVSIGGVQSFDKLAQVQQYSPLKYYSNFSLLMEGLTGTIPNPDTSFPAQNSGDTVQRPFDQIGPNWSHTKNKALPIEAMIAVPFSLEGRNFSVGFGAVQYASLNHYYENHNVLNPSVGAERPIPVELPASDSVPFSTQWSSYLRSRDGSIQGYGAALSGAVSEKLTLGVSGMYLKGSTDDLEERTSRGTLVFYRNWFRLDSVYGRFASSGTSDYKGAEFTISGIYHAKYVTIGLSVKPPSTVTRTYSMQIMTNTTGSPVTITASGEDKIRLPWRGSGGVSIPLLNNFVVGMEYEIRSYASATYQAADGSESSPWLSSSLFHVGAQFSPIEWLALRVGVRGQGEVFQEDGNPISGDPVSYTVYSGGVGLSFQTVHLNVAYEYGLMKYQDLYQTNVNLNTGRYHNIVADVSYALPRPW